MFPRKANCTRLTPMIDGIGIDVVDIERFKESIDRTPGLREKLFTPAEASKPVASLAARFAAKEALYKALSPAHGLAWHEAEVINLESGKPAFLFRGAIADLIDGAQVHLSLSHDGGIASAMVILER
jgi:holo-[acyl-carrier protein] synthase